MPDSLATTLKPYLIASLSRVFSKGGRGAKKQLRWAWVADSMVDKVIFKGSERAFAEIRDTIEGRPTQRTELTGPDGQPIMIMAGPRELPVLVLEGTLVTASTPALPPPVTPSIGDMPST